jgi:predicted O-methyltransferase YrrM
MCDILLNYGKDAWILEQIDRVFEIVESPNELTRLQAYTLAAIADSRSPDVILDLGTGLGNSAAVFGTLCPAAKTYTFDIDSKWTRITLPKLRKYGFAPNVEPVVGDMTKLDFSAFVGDANSVIVFWDAHGFSIADLVLAHIVPIIADRQHVVICHDVSYVNNNVLDYGGKTIWRGTDAYYSPNSKMSYVVVGWAMSVAEQVISIFDFCARNGMNFHSVDVAMGIKDRDAFAEIGKALRGFPYDGVSYGLFYYGGNGIPALSGAREPVIQISVVNFHV